MIVELELWRQQLQHSNQYWVIDFVHYILLDCTVLEWIVMKFGYIEFNYFIYRKKNREREKDIMYKTRNQNTHKNIKNTITTIVE